MSINRSEPLSSESSLAIGEIVKPHGLRGELKVRLYNPQRSALANCRSAILAQGETRRNVEITCSRFVHGDSAAIITVEGVTTMEAAEALRGAQLLVERASLAPLIDGEYYCQDLVGCTALDEHDQVVGQIDHIINHGASDILVIANGEWERLIPFVEDWVLEVDLERRTVRLARVEEWEAQRR